ncbi:MAG: TIGR02302 family protein [Xanthobacteraceae bacterium]|nr:TIGR02302 family protein [Xanthobacteraceae bacterium]
MLSRGLFRARAAILWERLWPALASMATAAGLFLAVSWLGLWLWLPPIGRAVGVGVFFIIAVAATLPLLKVRWPSRNDGLRRLDRFSMLPHRPATAIADKMAPEAGDQLAVALWRAHLERALRAASALKSGNPSPKLPLRDPFALRALVLVLVAVTFVAAGSERTRRVAAAFDWHGVVMPANYRLDAWVTPPAYTGRPPMILPGLRPGEPSQARSTAAVSVPAGSTLVVRATGQSGLDVAVAGGVAEAAKTGANTAPQAPKGTEEKHFTITDAGSATVKGVGEDVTWRFTAVPDRPPTIALAKEPEPQLRGSLLLNYKLEDDYGVVDAQATFERKAAASRPGGKEPRPLYEAPNFPLVLPQARTRNGAASTTKDLSEHPWAGVDVTMTLAARDEGNNEGRSAPQEMRLPERPFAKALPRALIEQRRNLALDAHAKDRVLMALDALTIAPERFIPETSVYLGLRSIYWQLSRAENDDTLRDVVTRLWAMAVMLEDGNVSETEKQLRAAQDALREALERGASDEEIKKLMDELRAALDKFMQALAEELRKNPQMARPLDRNQMRELRSQDLRNMLDRMERLARSGARDAAKQMLDQLRQMLDNLQMARPGGEQGDGDDDMQSALNELGEMIQKQQQLRDRTFRQGQDQRRQRGQQRQQGDRNQMGELRQDQQALREQLNKLLEELRKRGMMPSQGQQGQQQGQGQQGGEMDQLGRAGEAMGEAGDQLGDGDADGAVDSQGRALEAMRRGAQGMAQSMQQQMGQGLGPGNPGRTGQARANQDTDPLGRPMRGHDVDDTTVKVPGEIDVQRARRILEELRRRFGESFRPQLELDYIERLLKDY